MRWLALTILLLITNAAAQDAASPIAPRFLTVPIHLNPHGQPLAAYQLDLRDTTGSVRIVGIEGGDHQAFADPPHYDLRAIQHDRVILAAFSTLRASQLPTQPFRVATVHVMVTGEAPLQWSLTVTAAGDDAGRRIAIEGTIQPGNNP